MVPKCVQRPESSRAILDAIGLVILENHPNLLRVDYQYEMYIGNKSKPVTSELSTREVDPLFKGAVISVWCFDITTCKIVEQYCSKNDLITLCYYDHLKINYSDPKFLGHVKRFFKEWFI